ncbi:MAG TPA: type II secretion system protein [Solirubrobacterales bacterium]|nr:type II secretion system protein [Solirubrobacterales bacterium]
MRHRANTEAGFTIVEVLIAILILAIGAMTTFSLLSAATRNAQRAKASQVALEYAEQELEYLRNMEYKKLALTAAPQPSSDELNPNNRVRSAEGTFALQREPKGSYHELVIEGHYLYGGGEVPKGAVSPGPTSFSNGDVSGKVYRYIVWRNDEKCSEEKCPGKQDYKQIVVAVKLDSPASEASQRGYYEVQSNFVNPVKNSETDPTPVNGKVVTAQQFFLTDTPCSASGVTVRQEIAGNHLLHNTLGKCADGPQTGTTAGAPDALVIGSPPDPDPEDPSNPPEYDYSNDNYLDTSPDTGKGLQIRRDDTNGCHYEPSGTTDPESQVHRWVTDPMTADFVMTEKVTLQFWTESLTPSTSSAGRACVYLFKWNDAASPPYKLLTNTFGATEYWTYTPLENAPWPQEWTKVRLTMNFNEAPYTIPAGDRLGVALSVDRGNTLAEALSFMYDHPKFPTRLEVDTSTPLEGG